MISSGIKLNPNFVLHCITNAPRTTSSKLAMKVMKVNRCVLNNISEKGWIQCRVTNFIKSARDLEIEVCTVNSGCRIHTENYRNVTVCVNICAAFTIEYRLVSKAINILGNCVQVL